MVLLTAASVLPRMRIRIAIDCPRVGWVSKPRSTEPSLFVPRLVISPMSYSSLAAAAVSSAANAAGQRERTKTNARTSEANFFMMHLSKKLLNDTTNGK